MSKPKYDGYLIELRPLTKAEGGGWHITWPGRSGCMSDGETAEQASMLSASGNPTMANLSAIIVAVGRALKVRIEMRVAPV